jgi:hypothetical protein
LILICSKSLVIYDTSGKRNKEENAP